MATTVPENRTREPIALRGLRRRFGGVHALRDGSLELRPGEIHALIGENGSGKSTLLNILSGQLRADAGEIAIGATTLSPALAQRELARHVAFVTQELSLAPDLTVGENIHLGHSKKRRRWGIDWQTTHDDAHDVMAQLGVDIDPRTPLSTLRLDQRQLVEIARALVQGAPVLILDEPTSALSDEAVAPLLAVLRTLRNNGTSVVFVSHRLDELLDVADTITVLRNGRTVAARQRADYTRSLLVADMLGHEPEHYTPPTMPVTEGEGILKVRDLVVPGRVRNASFEVNRGEVVGLFGLAGSGCSEIARSLAGLEPTASARVELAGRRGLPNTPLEAIRRGLSFVPGDRGDEGLALEMSIVDNLFLSGPERHGRWRRIRRAAEAAAGRESARSMNLVAPSLSAPVGSLSGGNQQKVLLARCLGNAPRVLVLEEPTRGVDIGAKTEIHRILHAARDGGLGILITSSDLEEMLVLCDRFVVIANGRVVAQALRAEVNESRLSHLASGEQ
jgi:ABC-type sugar transport system ATPase subunit